MAASLGRTKLLMGRSLSHNYMPAACGLVCLAAAAGWLGAQTPDGTAVSERARAVHARALVFDGHVHAVDREFYHGGDIGQRKANGQSEEHTSELQSL